MLKQSLECVYWLLICLSVASCGGGSSAPDTSAPTAVITFPPQLSLTDGDSIIVYGKASDDNEITVVRVNGVDALSSDGYANWYVKVPLQSGVNTLVVETGDIMLNSETEAASVRIESAPKMPLPSALAYDEANNRLLVLDSDLDALLSVDVATGARQILSDRSFPDDSNRLRRAVEIEFDAVNNRVYVIDAFLDAVIAIDLITGVRTIVSDPSTDEGINVFANPTDLALDSDANILYVLNADSGANPTRTGVISINLVTGARVIVSDESRPAAGGNNFVRPTGMVLDKLNNRLIVVDSALEAVIAVDLASGERALISAPTLPNAFNSLKDPVDVVLDDANNRVLVADRILSAIMEVDLVSGARTIVSDLSSSGPRTALNDIEFDKVNNRLFLADTGSRAVRFLDLGSQENSIIARYNVPDMVSELTAPAHLVLDRDNNRLLVANDEEIIAVSLDSGKRSFVTTVAIPDAVNQLDDARDVAIDVVGKRLLVVDSALAAVVSVDAASGVRTILSSNTLPNTVNPFALPVAIALDAAENRALVLDVQQQSVIAVDLETGRRSVLAELSADQAYYTDITIDRDNNRLLVLEAEMGSVIAINLTDGLVSVVSGSNMPDISNMLKFPSAMSLDSQNNRVIVTNIGMPELVAVSLDTGSQTLVSSNTMPNAFNFFGELWGVALDVDNNRVYVADDSEGILAVDLQSGQRVVVSR